MTTPQEVLAKVPLFSMLSKRDLSRLANNAHDRTFPAGSVSTVPAGNVRSCALFASLDKSLFESIENSGTLALSLIHI